MRYLKYCLWVLVPAAVAVAVGACERTGDEPLLLLENGGGGLNLPPPTGPVADNSRCHVCHVNYEEEYFAVIHARAEIGCEDCHGASDDHCGDEDNITPPETMYPKAKINPSCMGCHPKDKISKVVSHKPVLAGTATKKKYCTDCHGKHRLGYRTRKWDKATGKLIVDDKVRMLTDETIKKK